MGSALPNEHAGPAIISPTSDLVAGSRLLERGSMGALRPISKTFFTFDRADERDQAFGSKSLEPESDSPRPDRRSM